MIYLAYATTGKEFEVEQSLEDLGIDVWCGRKIEFLRRGKKRYAEPVESPYLPNYLFLSLSEDEWHQVMGSQVKHLAKTTYQLSGRDERHFDKFKNAVWDESLEAQAIIKRNDTAAMNQFKAGQKIKDLQGRFGEQLLKFRRIVEAAHELFPMIEAETEMMGQTVTVRLDPLDVVADSA